MKLKIRLSILALLISFKFLFSQDRAINSHNGVNFIIDKFDTYNLVAIGETHDKVEVTDYYITLINKEEFRKKVDFIVVEMGNHLYQNVLDDYVSGKPIDEKELFKLWRDHTSCMLNDSDNTGMLRLLKAIRNANLNSKFKVRVLAGDPAVDWSKISCLQEFYKYLGSRDEFYTDVIDKYIIKNHKKGLLVMGNSHFNKLRTPYMIENNLQNPITDILNKKKAKLLLLNIMSASSFPYEKLKQTDVGRVILTDNTWIGKLKIGAPFLKDYELKEQTDGIIYLGTKKSLTPEKVTKFNDLGYEKELAKRKELPNCKK